MSCALLILLLSQAEAPQDVRDLIRALGADSPEQRDDAAARLKEIGPPAVPALEEATKDANPDIRGHAIRILEHIARAERLKGLVPSNLKVTLDLKDVPLSEAVAKALHPFGLTGARLDDSMSDRKVSLSLDKAGFWEALERFEAAAGVRLCLETGLFRWNRETVARSGLSHARVTTGSWGTTTRAGAPPLSFLSLQAWLPPGVWACSAEPEGLEVTDAAGGRIEARRYRGRKGQTRRALPSRSQLCALELDPDRLEAAKTIKVSGILIVRFARDIERIEVGIERVPVTVKVAGGDVFIDDVAEEGENEWGTVLEVSTQGEPYTFLASLEDAGGRWLGNLGTFTVDRKFPRVVSGSTSEPRDGQPARFVIFRAIGFETIKVPFTLTGIKPP